MAWYLAPSLATLRKEVDARWPMRDWSSDGTIGDQAHADTVSDHNPNVRESVNAWDMDKDGVDVYEVIRAFQKHPSAHYWIFNREIADKDSGWKIMRYTGKNPHDKHAHFSIRQSETAEQNRTPWGVAPKENQVTPDEIKGNVVNGIHSALDQAANRNTPTGRQMGDDLASLIGRHTAPLGAKLDLLAEAVKILLDGMGDEAARVAAKLEEMDTEATDRASVEAARDAELRGELDQLRVLFGQHQHGELDALAVVRQMGVLLSRTESADPQA